MLPGLDAEEFPYPQVGLGPSFWTHPSAVITIICIGFLITTLVVVFKRKSNLPFLFLFLVPLSAVMAVIPPIMHNINQLEAQDAAQEKQFAQSLADNYGAAIIDRSGSSRTVHNDRVLRSSIVLSVGGDVRDCMLYRDIDRHAYSVYCHDGVLAPLEPTS